MDNRTATVFVDYQQRASEFSVGDLAYPLAGGATDESQAGRVVAVYPGIGQVDIEFPWGSGRYSVEDVQRVSDIVSRPPAPEHTTVPGGAGAVSVPGGPHRQASESVDRVARAFVKHALYWASRDRHYKVSQPELDGGKYVCPRCKTNEDGDPAYLRPASYKRQDGKSSRLLACPQCLFLIKRCDIIGDPEYHDDLADKPDVVVEPDLDQDFEILASMQDLGLDKVQIEFLEDMVKGPVSTMYMDQPDIKKLTRLGLAEMDGSSKMKITSKGRKWLSQRSKKAADAPSQTLTVMFSGGGHAASHLARLMSLLRTAGEIGHSLAVVADPDVPKYRQSFDFDGDGADRIVSVLLDGEEVT